MNMKEISKMLTTSVLVLVVLVAGCTQGEDTEEESTGPSAGTLTMSSVLDDTKLEPGESTSISLDLTNKFSNSLTDIEVKLEPSTTGIDDTVDGPETLENNKTEGWTIDITTSEGLTPRTYSLYPVVCFDYQQEERGYFRVSKSEPSMSLDTSSSDNGPLKIHLNGLKSFSTSEDDEIDVEVTFSFADNINGAEKTYSDQSDLIFNSGDFVLDSVDGSLGLYTNEVDLNAGEDKYCVVQTSEEYEGYAVCWFDVNRDFKASDDIDFDVEVLKELDGEVESYFSTIVTYTYCIKSSDGATSITVEEAE